MRLNVYSIQQCLNKCTKVKQNYVYVYTFPALQTLFSNLCLDETTARKHSCERLFDSTMLK